jgi:hypothetical protein
MGKPYHPFDSHAPVICLHINSWIEDGNPTLKAVIFNFDPEK